MTSSFVRLAALGMASGSREERMKPYEAQRRKGKAWVISQGGGGNAGGAAPMREQKSAGRSAAQQTYGRIAQG